MYTNNEIIILHYNETIVIQLFFYNFTNFLIDIIITICFSIIFLYLKTLQFVQVPEDENLVLENVSTQ